MPDSPTEVFHRLVQGVANVRMNELPRLYAEDALVSHPFGPSKEPIKGRDGLRAHFASLPDLPIEMEVKDVVVHKTADPEVVIAEFAYEGRVTTTGRPLRIPNVFVLRVRDGEIVESRDYAHHVAFAEALGRLPELIAEYQARA
ncbi:nuclear transport factor 2 family protein [Actinomadura barringtoniae]|uniref:Nuclear transport factor 2 family protein n=1 Tax=Actinomadura barringtoniae TaxID=1427535 RepID=A0A939T331_9ACTN|nr:nuclear transport factor 2 family protein [Actinomadura barringtoniae]MBO2447503.1 nuclear transport factor 2 family protein [Actinomadura barringtoniae]